MKHIAVALLKNTQTLRQHVFSTSLATDAYLAVEAEKCHVTLASSTPFDVHLTNSISKYIVNSAQPIELEGAWETTYPHSYRHTYSTDKQGTAVSIKTWILLRVQYSCEIDTALEKVEKVRLKYCPVSNKVKFWCATIWFKGTTT